MLSAHQTKKRLAKALRLERERALKAGLGPENCRHFAYTQFVPSLASRIPFERDFVCRPPTNGRDSQCKKHGSIATQGAGRNAILHHVPLSEGERQGPLLSPKFALRGMKAGAPTVTVARSSTVSSFAAVKILLANSAGLYVDRKTFCDCLEPLVCKEAVHAAQRRDVLEGERLRRCKGNNLLHWALLLCWVFLPLRASDAFTRIQTNSSDVLDAFDLILGLSHFCGASGEERIKGMNTDEDMGLGR